MWCEDQRAAPPVRPTPSASSTTARTWSDDVLTNRAMCSNPVAVVAGAVSVSTSATSSAVRHRSVSSAPRNGGGAFSTSRSLKGVRVFCADGSSDVLPKVPVFRREDVMRCTDQSFENELGEKKRHWVIYKGDVFDLGKYLEAEEHPGGNAILEQSIGSDISEPFENIGHSYDAQKLLYSFKIGTLQESVEHRLAKTNSDDFLEKNDSALQSLVDFTAPLIPQVYRLTRQQYITFSSTFFCSTKVCDFFPNMMLEILSRTVWWVVPLVWVPLAVLVFILTRQHFSIPLSLSLTCTAGGLFLWTFLEYIIHRYIFHFPESALPDFAIIRVIHFLGHGVHHVLPMDPLRLVMPPALFFLLATPVYSLSLLLFPFWFVNIVMPGTSAIACCVSYLALLPKVFCVELC